MSQSSADDGHGRDLMYMYGSHSCTDDSGSYWTPTE